jgi:nitrite reductase/ring-hydroxylating ferredoxin subunit
MGRHLVCKASELPAGERKIVQVDGRSIGVFNVKGAYYALRNNCPHQGAPLCAGSIKGMMLPSMPGTYLYGREGEIVTCPWHMWEFDITTGKSIYDPHKCLVKTYEVTLEKDAGGDGSGQESPMEEEPVLETFPVTVEDGIVILHA